MFRIRHLALVAAISLPAICVAESTSAQVVGLRRGVIVRAPYVPSIHIGLRGAIPGVPLVRPYLFPRRRLLGPAYVGPAGAPVPAAAGPYAPGATTVDPRHAYPSAQQLASFDDGSLLNAVLDVTERLDADLAQFNTGAGWRTYLRLPDDALPPPTADGQVNLGFDSIAATLQRFDSVAAEREYAMISGLPSFAAARAALTELVVRFTPDGEAGAAASVQQTSAEEELPVPPPSLAKPANSVRGERSILGPMRSVR